MRLNRMLKLIPQVGKLEQMSGGEQCSWIQGVSPKGVTGGACVARKIRGSGTKDGKVKGCKTRNEAVEDRETTDLSAMAY